MKKLMNARLSPLPAISEPISGVFLSANSTFTPRNSTKIQKRKPIAATIVQRQPCAASPRSMRARTVCTLGRITCA